MYNVWAGDRGGVDNLAEAMLKTNSQYYPRKLSHSVNQDLSFIFYPQGLMLSNGDADQSDRVLVIEPVRKRKLRCEKCCNFYREECHKIASN